MSTEVATKTVPVDDAKARETVSAAERLGASDTTNLLEEIARREAVAQQDESVLTDPALDGGYATAEMALGDNLKEIGDRLMKVWIRRLHGVICGGSGSDEERKKIADLANLNESAAIAAVTAALLPFTSPLFAAPAAVIIVREFLGPAAEELCQYWAEKLEQPIG
ncbi:hypothetical protein AAFO92_04555 [Roseovarius sp. CAU 1744]|uniref:hypothetical protein n=1 Tax=Roseovarius sp. CAU 1744 TaxID=3140368 RepID=UPI00325A8B5F